MAAPLLLAGLGAGSSLIGSLFGSSAADKVAAERKRVMSEERARQGVLDTEAAGFNDAARDRYGDFQGQQNARASELAAMFKAPVTTPNTVNTTAPIPAAGSDQVQREIDKRKGIADMFVNNQADNLGRLRSFGDLFGDISRSQAADAQRVNQIGGFKKGSQQVASLEMDAASHAGDSDMGLANLFGGLGKVGLTAALSGQYVPAPGAPLDLTAPSVRYGNLPKFATPVSAMAVNPFGLY
ncbi:MAG: hypothetical protein WBB98_17675 [Xanthobacteraceae bacterium]